MPGVYLGHPGALGCYARGVFRYGGLTDLHCSGLHSPDNSDCGVGEEHGGGGGVRCFLVRCP